MGMEIPLSDTCMHHRHDWLLPVCTGLLGCALVLLATSRYGAGLSSDSVGYISAARSLVTDGTLTTYLGEPMVNWPPLYPALLASVYWLTGVDPLYSAAWVNTLLFGLIAGAGSLLFVRSECGGRPFALLGSIALVLAEPLLSVSRMALSELLFILWVVLFLLFAQRWRRFAGWGSLVSMCIVAALAALTRYIGVTLIATGLVLVLLDDRQRWMVRMRQGVLFSLAAALPLALWLWRNWIVCGSFMGSRAPSVDGLGCNLVLAFTALVSWITPYKLFPQISLALAVGALAAGLAAAVILLVRWARHRALRGTLLHYAVHLLQHETFSALLFACIYGLFLVISASTAAIDVIDSRLMSPLFVPLLWLVLVLMARFAQRWQGRTWLRHLPLTLFIVVFILYGGIVSGYRLTKCLTEGAGGYATDSWQTSETVAYLRSLSFDGPTFSNAPDVTYILADRPTLFSPKETAGRSSLVLNTLDELANTWPESSPALLVWFDNAGRSYLYTPAELQTIVNIEPLARLGDGIVYCVDR